MEVQHKVIHAAAELLPLFARRYRGPDVLEVWQLQLQLKQSILTRLVAEGVAGGVRSHALKYAETVAMLFADPVSAGEAGLRKVRAWPCPTARPLAQGTAR